MSAILDLFSRDIPQHHSGTVSESSESTNPDDGICFNGNVPSLSLSPNERLLALACEENVYIIDADTFEHVSVLSGHFAKVTLVHFESDDLVMSSANDATTRLWKLSTLKVKRAVPGGSLRGFTYPGGVILCPRDANQFQYCGFGVTPERFNFAPGGAIPQRYLTAHSIYEGGSVHFVNLDNGDVLFCTFRSSNLYKYVYTKNRGSPTEKTTCLNVGAGAKFFISFPTSENIARAKLSPPSTAHRSEGERFIIACGGESGLVKIFETSNSGGAPVFRMCAEIETGSQIQTLTPFDEHHFITGHADGKIVLFDVRPGKKSVTLVEADGDKIQCVVTSRNNTLFFSTKDGIVRRICLQQFCTPALLCKD